VSSSPAECLVCPHLSEKDMLRLTKVLADAVRTSVREGGNENSKEAAVFVHGNPGFSADWEDLMEQVAPFCRCIAPEMPGFRQSERAGF
jgi:pimeloyl-ACP methyl ester carboxylesterase